jgi:SAM-dependent methyltransferase
MVSKFLADNFLQWNSSRISGYMADQLRQPRGIFGRQVILHLLNHINVSINALAFRELCLTADDHVIEIGFGGGYLIKKMLNVIKNGRVCGVDFSQDAVNACKKRFARQIKRGILELHCKHAENLELAPDTYTKACTVNTIYFWANPLIALKELHRVLKKDGLLVLCLTPEKYMRGRNVARHGFTLYDPGEVSGLIADAGFRDVEIVFAKHRLGECTAVKGIK